MDRRMINYGYLLLCLLGALATVCNAVKITSLKVPPVYILSNVDNPEPLILDCEYDVSLRENGFVLKWLFNDHQIYQWIPSNHQPHSLSFMKNHINVNYTASTEVLHKYRALAIDKPTLNMTGTYSCNVGSFKSEDKRSSYLQIIRPESDMRVVLVANEQDDNVKVECIVKDIFPEPKLTIFIGETEKTDFIIKSIRDESDGLYDVIVLGEAKKDEIIEPSSVECVLQVANTNYTQRRRPAFYSDSSSLGLSTALVFGTIVAIALNSICNCLA